MTERYVFELDGPQTDIVDELIKAAIDAGESGGWNVGLLQQAQKSMQKTIPVAPSTYAYRALEVGDDFSVEVDGVVGWGQLQVTSQGRVLIHLSAGGEETVLRLYTASQIHLCERVFVWGDEDGTASG